ncbi:hypothetical protein M0805_006802 [Coniferiporia weirii]|nr:hypothetical protein M0805_006802 [Coniferiporia weirii]
MYHAQSSPSAHFHHVPLTHHPYHIPYPSATFHSVLSVVTRPSTAAPTACASPNFAYDISATQTAPPSFELNNVDALTHLPPRGRPLFYHTYSALRQEALGTATDMWARTYALDTPHHRSLAGRALLQAPSTALLSSWKAPASRALQSRAVQVVLGHGHFSAYAAHFLPNLPISCPCGAPLQTREHLLLECPIFQSARGPLPVEARPSAQPPAWGSKLGLGWLFPFLRRSTAFMRSFLHNPLLPPPPPDRFHPP